MEPMEEPERGREDQGTLNQLGSSSIAASPHPGSPSFSLGLSLGKLYDRANGPIARGVRGPPLATVLQIRRKLLKIGKGGKREPKGR